MVDLKSYFPQIGSSGEKPSDGKTWSPGDNYYAAHLTYLWDQVRKRFEDVENRLNAIDSDDDGVVDEADYANDADASTYKGNDIDSNGDGIVDQAVDADTVDGSHASDLGSGASDSGTQLYNSVTDFNYEDNLTVTDDGDKTVSISLNQGAGSGLNADQLDGVELSNITWGDVAMAQSDIGISDIGPAFSNLDMNQHSIDSVGSVNIIDHDSSFPNGDEFRLKGEGGSSTDGDEYLDLGYYDASDSTYNKQVEIHRNGNINTVGMINADGNAATKVEVRSSDPSSPETGQTWINTSQ